MLSLAALQVKEKTFSSFFLAFFLSFVHVDMQRHLGLAFSLSARGFSVFSLILYLKLNWVGNKLDAGNNRERKK